ncbi:hypothetical protein Vadar_021860 [Vaccinium darrowii]|uniref:Uncharacterized protein n=1 Tax=Vaccinium darrowii TaxID=229202 RepID=A0ACB7ZDT3_9ERIC|nr:hypothetical protein Vadar_021860 [Vaccinium darrowii]
MTRLARNPQSTAATSAWNFFPLFFDIVGMELLLAGSKYQLCTILRICDYKNAAQHVETLGAAMKADMQQMQHVHERTKELNDKRIPTPCSMMITRVIEAEDEEHLQWSLSKYISLINHSK